jgi:hypothetical protein
MALQAALGRLERVTVPVNADQEAVRTKSVQNRGGMAAAAERTVDVAAVRTDLQQAKHVRGEHALVAELTIP